MLEQHNLDVDTAESAEQALEYLTTHRPDVIFMDHLMPGMDGFQAVQAIKNNPRTATIPIMMYTSQEGDLYVGQARALGAMGVLPKQLKPVDVSKVLYQLNLMPDRHEAELPRVAAEARIPSVVVIGESAMAQGSSQYGASYARPETPAARPAAAELRAQLESIIKEQTTELRRFVIASLDSYASRVVSDLRGVHPEPVLEANDELPPEPKHTTRNLAVAATVLLIGLGAGLLWLGLEQKQLNERYLALQAQAATLEQGNRQLTTMVAQLTDTLAQRGAPAVAGLPAMAVTPQALTDVTSASTAPLTVESIPYGEVPLAGSRVDFVRTYLSQLSAQSFHGMVRIEIFPGRFCLVGNPTDGYSAAPEELAYSRCELVGNPALDNMTSAQRQSLAFVNMIAEAEKLGGDIRIEVASGSGERQASPYPNSAADGLTAGQWNRAAGANNRIEISAVAGT